MLASTYLQAKATCDQVSALDAILDKELMLETMQQDLPRSEALLSQETNENTLQDLSKDEMNKPNKKDETHHEDDVESIHENSDDDDIDGEMKRVHIKLPLDFDLSELAHNILMNNQKSRMNCVVERRRTEEVEEPKPMNPFNILMNEPKREKVTGERIAIFCESGAPKSEPEPVVQIRRIVMPFPAMHPMHRFGPGPQFQGPQMGPGPQFQGPQFPPQFPPQFMPQTQVNMPPQMNMPPPHMNINMPPNHVNMPPQMNMPPPSMSLQENFPAPPMRMPFPPQSIQFPQQQLPQVPAQMMTPPRPEVPQFRLISPAPQQQLPNMDRPQTQEIDQAPQPEVRIHLRRIQLPGPIGDIFPFLNNIQSDIQKEAETPRQNVQVQQMPLAVALSKVGITPDDLRNIQRMAEEKFQEHIRELVAEEDSDSSADSDSLQSEEDSDSGMQTAAPEENSGEEQKTQSKQELHEASSQQEQSDEQPQILALGRSNFGRSLNPIQLPGLMSDNAELHEAEKSERSERAAFVQPR